MFFAQVVNTGKGILKLVYSGYLALIEIGVNLFQMLVGRYVILRSRKDKIGMIYIWGVPKVWTQRCFKAQKGLLKQLNCTKYDNKICREYQNHIEIKSCLCLCVKQPNLQEERGKVLIECLTLCFCKPMISI